MCVCLNVCTFLEPLLGMCAPKISDISNEQYIPAALDCYLVAYAVLLSQITFNSVVTCPTMGRHPHAIHATPL